MVYIHTPHVPVPTRNAIALSEKLAEAVRLLRAEDPSITPADVMQGMDLAKVELRRELGLGKAGATVVFALLLAVMLAFGSTFYLVSSGSRGDSAVFYVVIGISVLLSTFVIHRAAKKARG